MTRLDLLPLSPLLLWDRLSMPFIFPSIFLWCRCIGDSLHLKSRFGVGHTVSVLTQHPGPVIQHLQEACSAIVVRSQNADQVVFQLPQQGVGRQKSGLVPVIRQLETWVESKSPLIREWGLSFTTLEDVFLKVGAEDQAPLRTGVVGEGFVANEGAILGHRPRRQHQASTAINGASSTEALARSLVASGPAEGSDWEGSEETESLCSE